MNRNRIKQLLEDLREGKIEVDVAMHGLKNLPYEDLGFSKLDTHRNIRKGFPEVIFCEGKTIDQIITIIAHLMQEEYTIMATRASKKIFDAIRKVRDDAVYHELARMIVIGKRADLKTDRIVLVVTAGTSDIPVAEEAAITCEVMGSPVERLFDVGIAGFQRLLDKRERLYSANVIVVVAGMDGALASAVGGMVGNPVVAVPTSIGYGASFNGLAALLSMLNCCAPGVAVMNIDNGFGGGYYAGLINLMEAKT